MHQFIWNISYALQLDYVLRQRAPPKPPRRSVCPPSPPQSTGDELESDSGGSRAYQNESDSAKYKQNIAQSPIDSNTIGSSKSNTSINRASHIIISEESSVDGCRFVNDLNVDSRSFGKYSDSGERSAVVPDMFVKEFIAIESDTLCKEPEVDCDGFINNPAYELVGFSTTGTARRKTKHKKSSDHKNEVWKYPIRCNLFDHVWLLLFLHACTLSLWITWILLAHSEIKHMHCFSNQSGDTLSRTCRQHFPLPLKQPPPSPSSPRGLGDSSDSDSDTRTHQVNILLLQTVVKLF